MSASTIAPGEEKADGGRAEKVPRNFGVDQIGGWQGHDSNRSETSFPVRSQDATADGRSMVLACAAIPDCPDFKREYQA